MNLCNKNYGHTSKNWKKLSRAQIEEVFRLKFIVADSGCWEWTAALCWGYGQFRLGPTNHRAHRFSYSFFVGPIKKGLLVCHKCDNKKCVNPEHLYAGIGKQNWRDAKARGSAPLGGRHGCAKLTNDQVREIRRLLASKIKGVEIAKRFGVAANTIHNIRSGTHWKSVQ